MSPKAAAAAVGIGVGAAAGAVAAVVGAPLVLGAVGFTSAGIAAGSFAASMMSAAAVANGGAVAAGSAVAVLQAAGAVGLSGAATAAVTGVGAAVGWLVSLISGKEKGDKSNKKPPNNGANPNLECLPMNPINLSGEIAATS